MRNKFRLFAFIFFAGYLFSSAQQNQNEVAIDSVLNTWHDAASRADYDAYFNLMTADGVFIGTDAEENWQNMEFKAFAKPYFDRGKAWSFTPLERNIYLDKSNTIAWFDELIDTQMGICRGSGIVIEQNGLWKIKHYVLSITVPNENVTALDSIKKEHDMLLIEKLKK
ncbi:MAG: nuclear transport factor 2 family protein [Leeuwenhoekiella sp.]